MSMRSKLTPSKRNNPPPVAARDTHPASAACRGSAKARLLRGPSGCADTERCCGSDRERSRQRERLATSPPLPSLDSEDILQAPPNSIPTSAAGPAERHTPSLSSARTYRQARQLYETGAKAGSTQWPGAVYDIAGQCARYDQSPSSPAFGPTYCRRPGAQLPRPPLSQVIRVIYILPVVRRTAWGKLCMGGSGRWMGQIIVSLLLAALSPSPAQAADGPEASDTSDQGAGRDIVVTAARTALPANALPLTIEVIDKETLDQQVIISGSVTDAVATLTPSFSPTRQKLSGAGETLRGRAPLYAINGIPQSTPLRDGSRDGFTIDGFFVDRVELIFGSNALQGIGGAGGIVNQVTVGAPGPRGSAAARCCRALRIAISMATVSAAGGRPPPVQGRRLRRDAGRDLRDPRRILRRTGPPRRPQPVAG